MECDRRTTLVQKARRDPPEEAVTQQKPGIWRQQRLARKGNHVCKGVG